MITGGVTRAPDGGGLKAYVRNRANPYAASSTKIMKKTVNTLSFLILTVFTSDRV